MPRISNIIDMNGVNEREVIDLISKLEKNQAVIYHIGNSRSLSDRVARGRGFRSLVKAINILIEQKKITVASCRVSNTDNFEWYAIGI